MCPSGTSSRGVGENLQDHPFITCLFELGDEDTLYGADRPKPMAEWVLRRSGPLTSTAAEVVAFVRTRAGLAAADIQFHIGALYYEDHGAATFEGHCATIAPVLVSPRSRGRVWLRSADPRDKPRILTNSLAERDDVDSLVAGMRLAREIAGQEPLAATVRGELQPGADAVSDEELEAALRRRVELIYHPVGTCAIGDVRDLGGGPRAAGARPRRAAGGGRVGDAADHRRQHPRSDGDDRRARGRPDPRPADARRLGGAARGGRRVRVAIVGAGFSGIAMAIALKREGIEDFTVLERADDLGGVWHHNTYPGAACDVPSYLYSYSYDQRRDWSQPCSPQQEILDYLHDTARKHGVIDRVRTGTEVESAEFDDHTARWTLRTAAGETIEADALVVACGQLSRPRWPSLPGMDEFRGHSFHSAEWDHDYDMTGRRVAVIGTGASAIQFVPEVAERAAHLDVYQRSAPYMLPRNNDPYPDLMRRAIERVPGLQAAPAVRDVAVHGDVRGRNHPRQAAGRAAAQLVEALHAQPAEGPRGASPGVRPTTPSAASGSCSAPSTCPPSSGRTWSWSRTRWSASPPRVWSPPTAASERWTASSTAPASAPTTS